MAYSIKTPKAKEQKSVYEVENETSFKDEFRDLRNVYEEVTTSDFQGIVETKAKYLISKYELPPEKEGEIEDILIQYGQGEMDINTAQRYLLEIKK